MNFQTHYIPNKYLDLFAHLLSDCFDKTSKRSRKSAAHKVARVVRDLDLLATSDAIVAVGIVTSLNGNTHIAVTTCGDPNIKDVTDATS